MLSIQLCRCFAFTVTKNILRDVQKLFCRWRKPQWVFMLPWGGEEAACVENMYAFVSVCLHTYIYMYMCVYVCVYMYVILQVILVLPSVYYWPTVLGSTGRVCFWSKYFWGKNTAHPCMYNFHQLYPLFFSSYSICRYDCRLHMCSPVVYILFAPLVHFQE